MATRIRREALRGAEVQIFDLMSEVLTSAQWMELLKAPLEHAVAHGKRDLAQKLVGAGAEVGETLLHKAVRGRHGEIVIDLLERGASFNARDTEGSTPLHLAAQEGQTEMVQLLLLKGANKDAFGSQLVTPLYLAALHGHMPAVLALLAAGADVSIRFGVFNAPLMNVVAEKGRVDVLRAVIEHGADVNAVDSNQHTALHQAAGFGNKEAVDVLIEAGANIEARESGGFTPLHCASSSLNRETLRCLLAHGLDVNAQTNSLETPLILAAMIAGTHGAAEVVDSLLRAGADETMVNDDGKKAVDVIAEEVTGLDCSVADVERVRELLANAPGDRAWRRRGYLVLCRAHPDRWQQSQVVIDTYHTETARRARSYMELARGGLFAGNRRVEDNTGGDWAVVVGRALRLREEGIFRTIVGYT